MREKDGEKLSVETDVKDSENARNIMTRTKTKNKNEREEE